MSPSFPRKVYIGTNEVAAAQHATLDSHANVVAHVCSRSRRCRYICATHASERSRKAKPSFPSAIEQSRVPGCDTLASPSLTILSLCSSSKPTSRRTSPAATSRWDSCESAQATAPAHFSRQALRVAVNKLKENPDLVARKACPPPMTGFIACNCSMWSKRGNDLPYFVLLPPPGFYVLRT